MRRPTPRFYNFDSVTQQGGAWAPCETDPAVPPPYPCLRVPVDGTYLVTASARWENNTTGNRTIDVAASVGGCAPGDGFSANFYHLVFDNHAASSLTLNSAENKRLQGVTGVAELEAGQCLMGHLFVAEADSNQTVDFSMSLTRQ